MKKNRLQTVLDELDIEEIRRSVAEGKVPSEFIKIAETILNGHFYVSHGNDNVKVYPTCVELYWHEENGNIKDYIVYHRNSAKKKPAIFETGILHNHVSGIDLTFELGGNPESAIRASALIREFMVKGKNGEWVEITKIKNGKEIKSNIENRSTYIYEYLFGQFSIFDGGFSVEWKDDENASNTVSNADCTPRYNVAEYDIKDDGNIKKKPYKDNTSSHKTANGKYVQDERLWRFAVSGHDTRF